MQQVAKKTQNNILNESQGFLYFLLALQSLWIHCYKMERGGGVLLIITI